MSDETRGGDGHGCRGGDQITGACKQERHSRIGETTFDGARREYATGIDGASLRDNGPFRRTSRDVAELVSGNSRELRDIFNGQSRAGRKDLDARGQTRLDGDEVAPRNGIGPTGSRYSQLYGVGASDCLIVVRGFVGARITISEVPFHRRDWPFGRAFESDGQRSVAGRQAS